MDQDRFAWLELGVVEQHMLDCAERDRRERCRYRIDTRRCWNQLTGRNIDLFLRKAIEMEAVDTGHILTQIVATFTAMPQSPQVRAPYMETS